MKWLSAKFKFDNGLEINSVIRGIEKYCFFRIIFKLYLLTHTDIYIFLLHFIALKLLLTIRKGKINVFNENYDFSHQCSKMSIISA